MANNIAYTLPVKCLKPRCSGELCNAVPAEQRWK